MTTTLKLLQEERKSIRQKRRSKEILAKVSRRHGRLLRRYYYSRDAVEAAKTESDAYRKRPELLELLNQLRHQYALLWLLGAALLLLGLLELRFVIPGLVEGEFLTVQGIAKNSGLDKSGWIKSGLALLLFLVTILLVLYKAFVPSPYLAWKNWQEARHEPIVDPSDPRTIEGARTRLTYARNELRFALLMSLLYLGLVGGLLAKNVEIGHEYLERLRHLDEAREKAYVSRENLGNLLFSADASNGTDPQSPVAPDFRGERSKPSANGSVANPRTTITAAIFFVHFLLLMLPVKASSIISLRNSLAAEGCSGHSLQAARHRKDRHEHRKQRSSQLVAELLRFHGDDDFVWSALQGSTPKEILESMDTK